MKIIIQNYHIKYKEEKHTHWKITKQKPQRNKTCSLLEKENLKEIKNLPGPPEPNPNYTIERIFVLTPWII